MNDPSMQTASRRPLWRGAAAVALGAAWLLVSGAAQATPGFPNQIRSDLRAPSTPGCTLCHATTAGGGPVTQPFGQAMLARGLEPANAASLSTALQALEAEGTDSDGDGLGDIEELRQGLDPNYAGDAGSEPPVYGCGAQVVPQAPNGGSAAVVALGMALALLIRRRPKGRIPRGSAPGAKARE